MGIRLPCFLLCALLAAEAVWPQSHEDERSVLDTVDTLLEAIREGNAAAAAGVLHPAYRVTSWYGTGRDRHLFVDTREGELVAFGKLKPGEWDVRLLSRRVSIDSNGLANVWARYEFYSFGKLDHCGTESYELLHLPEGWRVVNFSDTDTKVAAGRTSEVCPAVSPE